MIQLFRDEGLSSARHPDNPVEPLGGPNRQKVEGVLEEIGGKSLFPSYAIVERQENDSGYIQQVGNYGSVWEHQEMGILAVLSIKSEIVKRSTFTFGDSTYCLTSKERKQKEREVLQTDFWGELEAASLLDHEDKKSELESKISKIVFPDGKYKLVTLVFNKQPLPLIIPSEQTIAENLLGMSVLLPAFKLRSKLLAWNIIDDSGDCLEAQIFGPLKPFNCERILINKSIKPYLDRVLDLIPEIKEKIIKLEEKDIIRYH